MSVGAIIMLIFVLAIIAASIYLVAYSIKAEKKDDLEENLNEGAAD